MNILLISGKFLPIYNKEKRGAIQKLERIYLEYNDALSNGDHFTIYSPKIAKDNFDSEKLKNATFRNIDLTTKRYHILKYLYAVKHRLQRTKNNEYYIREIIKDIKRRHEENKYDLIIFENEEGDIPIFKKKTKTKTRIALHLHNDYVSVDRKYSQKILNSCDEVWCVSKFIENRVKKVKNIKTVIIPNTFEKFPEPDKKTVAKLKKKYDSESNIIFLYVGRLIESKGVHELVEAFYTYNAKNPSSKLIIIGDSDKGRENQRFAKKIQNKIARQPNISLVGFKNPKEISAYCKIATAQIIPSKCNEAFGLVALEAMHANLPIIASDSGALKEICGNKAIYVSKKNAIDEISKAMEKIATTEKKPPTNHQSNIKRYAIEKYQNNIRNAIHGKKVDYRKKKGGA